MPLPTSFLFYQQTGFPPNFVYISFFFFLWFSMTNSHDLLSTPSRCSWWEHVLLCLHLLLTSCEFTCRIIIRLAPYYLGILGVVPGQWSLWPNSNCAWPNSNRVLSPPEVLQLGECKTVCGSVFPICAYVSLHNFSCSAWTHTVVTNLLIFFFL